VKPKPYGRVLARLAKDYDIDRFRRENGESPFRVLVGCVISLRTKDEVTRMREEHDPIEQVRRRLVEQWQVADDELKKIDGKVREVVNEAAEFATHDPEPDVSELWTDILLEARA